MKILLSGADGFTGRELAPLALTQGHEVHALRADLADPAGLRAEILSLAPDAVIHLAAISFVGHGDDNAFYAVNVVGTTNLLAALALLPKVPRRVLLASSANIYGNCEHSPITETQAPAPVNHYAMSKLAMEYLARAYAERLPLVVTRPFNYTGPGQALNFVIPKLVDHFVRRQPTISLGNLHVEREFNDVSTVCDAYLRLLEWGVPGEVYNVCSGQPHALQEVIDALQRITGHRPRVEVNPAFVRANEVHRLCGSPAKLDALMADHGFRLHRPGLDETLGRMLDAARGGGAGASLVR